MKNYIIFLAGLIIIFSACKKMEDAPIDSTDTKLTEALTTYQNQLTQAQFGWKGYLLTNANKSATFLFSFTDKNRTTMAADYAVMPKESSYRLKALQRPTLLFDTYSTLHLLADPTPAKFGGKTGAGYYSDFEFAFVSASTDTIRLEGTFNKSKLILVRSKSDADNASTFLDAQNMDITLSKLRTYFKQSTIDGIKCEIKINPKDKIFGINYLDPGGILQTSSSNYFVSGTSLILFNPVVIGTKTITGLNSVIFDPSTGFISANTNDGLSIQIKEAITPLKYDPSIAAKFLANPVHATYSESYTGFTVDGVIDAYGVNTIPTFYSVDYYPKVPGQTYGAVRFWVGSTYGAYGAAVTPTVSVDGKLSYIIIGSYGTAPIDIRPIIINTTNHFAKPNGFYVIQTAAKSYDLVAVDDARSWITFQ